MGLTMHDANMAQNNFDMAAMVSHNNWQPVNIIGSIATLLLIPVLAGFFISQYTQLKKFAFVGLLMMVLGLQLYTWLQVDETILWPLLAAHAPALVDLQGPMFSDKAFHVTYIMMGALFIPGSILFGGAMLKARVFPKMAILAFTVGASLFVLGGPMIVVRTIGLVLLSASLVWIGLFLFRNKE